MFAHRSLQPIKALHIDSERPSEFAGCRETEVIVLPVPSLSVPANPGDERVRALAGTLSRDFPDEI